MKKAQLYMTIFLLYGLLCLIGPACVAQAEADEESGDFVYYRSNRIGMRFEEISQDRVGKDAAPEYLLRVRSLPAGGREELLLRGEEEMYTLLIERLPSGVSEKEFRGGEKTSEWVYRNGLPRYYWESGEDGQVRERRYYWEGDTLVSYSEEYGGNTVWRHYFVGDSGMLRQVRGDGKISSYLSDGEGRILSEWYADEDTIERIEYGGEGNYRMESYKGGELVKTCRSGLREEGGSRVILENLETQGTTTELYDEKGRLLERIERGDGTMKREVFRYEGKLLLEKTVRSKKTDRQILYSYDEEAELVRTETFVAGELRKIVRYREDSRIETIYRKGEPVYRDVYRGEELLKRENLD